MSTLLPTEHRTVGLTEARSPSPDPTRVGRKGTGGRVSDPGFAVCGFCDLESVGLLLGAVRGTAHTHRVAVRSE